MPIDRILLKRIANNDAVVKKLSLSGKGLTDEDIDELCEALKTNSTVDRIDLHDNNIGDRGAIALARAQIHQPHHFAALGITSNHIGPAGAKALALTTLTYLEIAVNHIGDEGIIALAQNKTLQSLGVGNNQATDNCAPAFSENTSLTKLSLLAKKDDIAPHLANQMSTSAQKLAHSQILNNWVRADQLIDSCQRGAMLEVSYLLKQGVLPYGIYVHEKLGNTDNLLHVAVRLKNAALLQLLFQYGAGQADQHKRNEDKLTYKELAEKIGWTIPPMSSARTVIPTQAAKPVAQPQAQTPAERENQKQLETAKRFRDLNEERRQQAAAVGAAPQVVAPQKAPTFSFSPAFVPAQRAANNNNNNNARGGNENFMRLGGRKATTTPTAAVEVAATAEETGSTGSPPDTKTSVTQPVAQLNKIPSSQLVKGNILGSGAYGTVYEGRLYGKPVAVKELQQSKIDAKALRNFNREAKLLENLHYDHIVAFRGVLDSEIPTLLMEFVGGGTLLSLLENKAIIITEQERLRIAHEIALAINYLHLWKIVHGDIKPDNVLMSDDAARTVKLTDFGLAKTKSALSSEATLSTGGVCGTPAYMAPELLGAEEDDYIDARDDSDASHDSDDSNDNNAAHDSDHSDDTNDSIAKAPSPTFATDIFSLGILLNEIERRERPFKGLALFGIINAICTGKRPTTRLGDKVDKKTVDASDDYTKLIFLCWAQKAKGRPTSENVSQKLLTQYEASKKPAQASGAGNALSNSQNSSTTNNYNSTWMTMGTKST